MVDGSSSVYDEERRRKEKKREKKKWAEGWGFIYLWAGPDWKSSPLSSETSLIVA